MPDPMAIVTSKQHGVVGIDMSVADFALGAASLSGAGQIIITGSYLTVVDEGSKRSNPAVATARPDAGVTFIQEFWKDAFGNNALALWLCEGIMSRALRVTTQLTDAMLIHAQDDTSGNGIVVADTARSMPTRTEDDTLPGCAVRQGICT